MGELGPMGLANGRKNEINRGSTEKRQDAILMTSSQRQKCLSDGPDCCQFYYLILNIVKRCWILETALCKSLLLLLLLLLLLFVLKSFYLAWY